METGPEPPWRDLTILFLLIFLFPSPLLFSHQVLSNSLRLHGLRHTTLICPPLSPRVYTNSCPLNQWCHLTISPSATRFSAFNLSQHQDLFQWVSSYHQVAKVLKFQLTSNLPMNIQDWFPLNLLVGSPCSPRNSEEFSSITIQKHQFWDFPGGLVAKTLCSQCRGPGFDLLLGN